MKLFINVTPEQGKALSNCSELSMTIEGQSVTCKILELEGDRLYLQPDEKYQKVLEAKAEEYQKSQREGV